MPHATSLVLHLIAVWLVQRLCRDLGFGLWTSVGVALVFGVHALQVESVVWVSARKNVLVAVFTLAFLRSHLAAHPVRASVWLLLALCSKATAVGLPLVAAAAQTLGLGAPRGRASWAWIAMWTVPCVLRAWLSLDAQADIIARTAAVGFAGRMAVMGSVLTTQARQVIFPTDLSVLYDPPRREWSDPVLLGQWALLAAIVAGAAWFVRRDRRLAWLAVFAIAMLAPTINVFPGPAYQADRYLHLPLVGIAALLLAAAGLLARVRPWLPAVVVGAWVGVVLVPLTLFRESHWRDHDTLFAETVRTT